MCGIVGLVDFSQGTNSISDQEFQKTLTLISHRGPDASQFSRGEQHLLGHTRLSIIDTANHANQPFISEDGRYKLIYNGEIYNFKEIRRELEALGVVFRTNSDTEALFHLLIKYGEQAISKLNGMFAFAFLDCFENKMILARDRFGIKPLYYSIGNSTLYFSSELTALTSFEGIRRELNVKAIPEFLQYGSSLGEQTFYKGVNKLPVGHYMIFDNEGQTITEYWNAANSTEIESSFDDAIATVRDKLRQAVSRQLVADVDVGIFLSGGIDSSAITLLAAESSSKKLNTYSVAYDFQGAVNELAKAKVVANMAGTNHTELFIESNNVVDVMEALVIAHGQPFGDAANIPLYMLCEKINGNPKVILQGDGGDELFAGYSRYMRTSFGKWANIVKPFLPLGAKLFDENSKHFRALRTLNAFSQKDPSLVNAMLMSQESPFKNVYRCFSDEFSRKLIQENPFEYYQMVYSRLAGLDDVKKLMFTDMSILLPDVYFEKVDRSTMHKSIEVRVPFMDNELVDYVMSLSSSLKVNGGQKGLLKESLKGIVPDAVLHGPKTGFGVPFSYWYKSSLYNYARERLLGGKMMVDGLLNHKVTEDCLYKHKIGKEDNGFLINKLVQMELWYERFM